MQRDSGAESGVLTGCCLLAAPLPSPLLLPPQLPLPCSSQSSRPVLADLSAAGVCLSPVPQSAAGGLPPPARVTQQKAPEGAHPCQLESEGLLRRKAGLLGGEAAAARTSDSCSPAASGPPPPPPSPFPHRTRAGQGSGQVTLTQDARRKASRYPSHSTNIADGLEGRGAEGSCEPQHGLIPASG